MTESLDTGRDPSLRLCAKVVRPNRFELIWQIPLLIFSVIYPTVAQKSPRPQKCRPQYRCFSIGNSSNSLLEVQPLIRRMISLGAIVDGAETRMSP
jgi:hypothetical protein